MPPLLGPLLLAYKILHVADEKSMYRLCLLKIHLDSVDSLNPLSESRAQETKKNNQVMSRRKVHKYMGALLIYQDQY